MSRSRTCARRLLVGVTAATLLFAACSSSSTKKTTTGSAQGGGAVKLGFFGAKTGADAQLGLNGLTGAKLALEQHKAKGGPAVDLVEYDSQGDPAQAPQLAQKAVSDKVVAIIGPMFSGESKTADPIFEQAAIVNVSPSATAVTLAQNGWKYWHRILANDDAQGPADAAYIARKLNAKKVAVIDDRSEYGKGLADSVRSKLQAAGVAVVNDSIDPKAQDFSSTVNTVNSAKVDAVFFGGYYSAAGRLVKQLRDASVKVPFVSGDGSADERLVENAGSPATAEGVLVTCACVIATAAPNLAAFVNDYKNYAKSDPGTYSTEGYDTANLLLAAIDAGKTTSKDINDYLRTASYNGLSKTIKFDDKGESTGGVINMYVFKGGKLNLVGDVAQLVGG